LRLPDGSVAGVLQQRIGVKYALVARRWTTASGWAPQFDLSETVSGNRRDMDDLAVIGADAGGYVVAWIQSGAVTVREIAPDGAAGAIARVSAPGGVALKPALAFRDNRPLLVFAVSPGALGASGPRSAAAAENDGSGWGAARTIGTRLANNQAPVVAARGGEAVVLWTHQRVGSGRTMLQIAAVRSPSAGQWEQERLLSSQSRQASSPSIGFDDSETAVASWSAGGATQTSTTRRAGPWTTPIGHGRAGLAGSYSSTGPAVANDGRGGLVLALGDRPGVLVGDWRAGRLSRLARAVGQTGWQYGFGAIAAAPTGAAAVLIITYDRATNRTLVSVALREPPGVSNGKAGR
jgi:hypothetical protein